MPFGKYKGRELKDIPKKYLRWLYQQNWLGGWLANGVKEILGLAPKKPPKKPWKPSEGELWGGPGNG